MESVETLEGKEIGKYKLHHLVGDGGQAVVYKAWHTDLHAWVAIKFLKNDLAKREAVRQRFKQEARMQFRLQHPHIVRVIEILDEGSWLGMAMDWVEGQDLERYLEKHPGPVPYTEIERLLLPVLHGVDHAHKQQIIHRDLKPSNVMLHGAAGEEIPKVMDFGIAKSLNQEESQTKTGSVLGTPSYLAPEQAQSTKHVDHRADIYALGITLYQMIAGRLPFFGEDILQVIMAHFTEPPPPFERFGLIVHPSIRAVVHKAIEKSPDARFSSCKEFAVQLQAALKEAIASGEHSALPTAQNTYSADSLPQGSNHTTPAKRRPSELLPSGEVAPEHNTLLRSPTLLPEEYRHSGSFAAISSKRHLVALAAVLLVALTTVAFVFRGPQTSPNNQPQEQTTAQRANPSPTVANPIEKTPSPSVQTPHPPRATNPPHATNPPNTPPSSSQTSLAVGPSPQRRLSPRPVPSLTTARSRPRKRPKQRTSQSLGRCVACLQSFSKENFGPDGDGLHPCTLIGMQRAARACQTPCQRDILTFCRSYHRVGFPSPLGGTLPISSMPSCRAHLPKLLRPIAQYSGYRPPHPKSVAACRKLFSP